MQFLFTFFFCCCELKTGLMRLNDECFVCLLRLFLSNDLLQPSIHRRLQGSVEFDFRWH